MLNAKFGIEVEFTGISRAKAARIVKEHFGGELKKEGGYYDKYVIKNTDGRKWTLMSDGSAIPKRINKLEKAIFI